MAPVPHGPDKGTGNVAAGNVARPFNPFIRYQRLRTPGPGGLLGSRRGPIPTPRGRGRRLWQGGVIRGFEVAPPPCHSLLPRPLGWGVGPRLDPRSPPGPGVRRRWYQLTRWSGCGVLHVPSRAPRLPIHPAPEVGLSRGDGLPSSLARNGASRSIGRIGTCGTSCRFSPLPLCRPESELTGGAPAT